MYSLGEETIEIERDEEETARHLSELNQNAQEEDLFVPESESGQEWIQMTKKSKCILISLKIEKCL